MSPHVRSAGAVLAAAAAAEALRRDSGTGRPQHGAGGWAGPQRLTRQLRPGRRSAGLVVAAGSTRRFETGELSVRCALVNRFVRLRRGIESGMTTAEYAVGTLAACAFAAVLLAVVRSGGIKSALAAVITTALGTAS